MGIRSGTAAAVRALVLVTLVVLGARGALGADAPKKDDPRMPKAREYSYIYDLMDNSLIRPTTRIFDPALLVRKISGHHREAANVDERDEVRLPSTWWQPRLGFRTVSADQMLHGPGQGKGPAPGRWTITKAKTQGVTPGFQVKDAAGDRFIVKFDPIGYAELATSTDVMGSYLFWAAGYNVPENTLVLFHPDSLDIDKDATYKDALGRDRPFTRDDLASILTRVARRRDGRFRAVASRFIKGKPLGPFHYYGRRRDDPEDLVPHEHRRELRGLWTIAAWLNHADSRGPNSLDAWVEDGGRSFVRHYLIDFGSILGSSALGPRFYSTGTEYYVDANVMLREFASLGLAPFEWENVVDPKLRSIGFIEAQEFDPVGWRPDYPNPAFDERTARDVRWGARIVAAFSDDMIRAAVNQGQFTDRVAAEYLIRTLIARRDKIAAAWLGPGAYGKVQR